MSKLPHIAPVIGPAWQQDLPYDVALPADIGCFVPIETDGGIHLPYWWNGQELVPPGGADGFVNSSEEYETQRASMGAILEDQVVTVGEAGQADYQTLAEALNYFSVRAPAMSTPSDTPVRAIVRINSGFVLTEKRIKQVGPNMPHVQIMAEDEVVQVDVAASHAAYPVPDEFTGQWVFLMGQYGFMPRLLTKLHAINVPNDGREYWGVAVQGNARFSTYNFAPGPFQATAETFVPTGISGFDVNLWLGGQSQVYLAASDVEDARQVNMVLVGGSAAVVNNCLFRGAGERSVALYGPSIMNVFSNGTEYAHIGPEYRSDFRKVAGVDNNDGSQPDIFIDPNGAGLVFLGGAQAARGGCNLPRNRYAAGSMLIDRYYTGDTRFAGRVENASYTVAGLAALSDAADGTQVFVSDGAAGSPVMAFKAGASWLRCDTLAPVSES